MSLEDDVKLSNADFDRVMIKIKKLLNLAADKSNEHESATAARQAASLMMKHNIAMADVIAQDIKSHDDNISDEPLHEWSYRNKFPLWISTLAIDISDVFQCKIKMKWNKDKRAYQLQIMGYVSDIQITKYLFMFLTTEFEKLAEAAWQEQPRWVKFEYPQANKWKREYKLGLTTRIRAKLDELYAESKEVVTSDGSSLVVIKEHAITAKYGVVNYNTVKSNVTDAYVKGIRDSDKINLKKVVEDTQESPELIGE